MADLYFTAFIAEALKRASYEYGKATKSWCGWLEDFPGIYAQAKTVEGVRNQLTEMLESYILMSLKEGKELPGFRVPFARAPLHAKTR